MPNGEKVMYYVKSFDETALNYHPVNKFSIVRSGVASLLLIGGKIFNKKDNIISLCTVVWRLCSSQSDINLMICIVSFITALQFSNSILFLLTITQHPNFYHRKNKKNLVLFIH